MSGNGGGALTPLRAALLVLCCLPLCSLTAGESRARSRTRSRRTGGIPQLFQLGPRSYLACMLLNDDEMGGGSDSGGGEGRGAAACCLAQPSATHQ